MLKLFSSTPVIVRVEDREFRLPKELLCYNSTFFDRAFNGPWSRKDGGGDGEREIRLGFATPDIFELVIQWMYISDVVLPPVSHLALAHDEPAKNHNPADTVMDPTYLGGEGVYFDAAENSAESSRASTPVPAASHAISNYVAFLKLADALGLLGPFDIIINRITTALLTSEEALQGTHIREASELPRGHAVRRMFAQVCVRPYVQATITTAGEGFRFADEVLQIEGFAADLFYELGEEVRRAAADEGQRH